MPKHLVAIVNDYCHREIGALPDLTNPKGYNDKASWLKLHDQMTEHVICCDKLLARSYVSDRIGRDCLLDVYQIARTVDDIVFEALPEGYVLKTNHDSGSVYVVTGKSTLKHAKKRLRKSIKRTYGVTKGEWAYAHISPYVFVEELMHGPTTDYKFHCCSGKIRWVQIIEDRAVGNPRETMVDETYKPFPLHFNYENTYQPEPPVQPATWHRMKEIARTLSEPFRYVRVDLYEYENRPVFGEFTFWPLGGLCRTKDERAFGDLLDFDTTFKRPMIHDVVEGNTKKHGPIRRLAEMGKKRLHSMAGTAF